MLLKQRLERREHTEIGPHTPSQAYHRLMDKKGWSNPSLAALAALRRRIIAGVPKAELKAVTAELDAFIAVDDDDGVTAPPLAKRMEGAATQRSEETESKLEESGDDEEDPAGPDLWPPALEHVTSLRKRMIPTDVTAPASDSTTEFRALIREALRAEMQAVVRQEVASVIKEVFGVGSS